MTNEEIQRVMEFIIKQQESFSEKVEQFSAKLELMRELHDQRIGQLERAAINLYNTVEGLGKTVDGLGKTVEGLGKTQNVLTVKMIELAEAQAHTDQRLNVLIDIVQQGRGGKPEL